MSEPNPRTKAIEQYLRGWPLLGVLVITIACSFGSYALVKYAIINGAYGTDAWDNGLRVVDKHGHLSDGRVLSGFLRAVLNFGSFLLCVPFFVGSAFGLAYLNMRLHGKRLSDFAASAQELSQESQQ